MPVHFDGCDQQRGDRCRPDRGCRLKWSCCLRQSWIPSRFGGVRRPDIPQASLPVCRSLVSALRASGHRGRLCRSARSAVDRLRQDPPRAAAPAALPAGSASRGCAASPCRFGAPPRQHIGSLDPSYGGTQRRRPSRERVCHVHAGARNRIGAGVSRTSARSSHPPRSVPFAPPDPQRSCSRLGVTTCPTIGRPPSTICRHTPPRLRLRRSSCDPSIDGDSGPCGRSRSSCDGGIHGCACAAGCAVETSSS